MRLPILGLVLLSSLAASADPMEFPGYVWDSPVKFSQPEEGGVDAFMATYPADAEPEKAQMDLLVVHTPRESVMTIKEAGADPASVALSTFLGLTGRPQEVNKTLFMGETEARSVYNASIPRPNVVHVFQKYLEDGTLVTVALRDYGAQPAKLVGDVLRGISETFKPN